MFFQIWLAWVVLLKIFINKNESFCFLVTKYFFDEK